MTQVINKKLMKCCDNCRKYMNGACAWLSLGNEYCTEILETQEVIDQLTNNWNELEEYIEKESGKYIPTDPYMEGTNATYEEILDKMKEIKERKNENTNN